MYICVCVCVYSNALWNLFFSCFCNLQQNIEALHYHIEYSCFSHEPLKTLFNYALRLCAFIRSNNKMWMLIGLYKYTWTITSSGLDWGDCVCVCIRYTKANCGSPKCLTTSMTMNSGIQTAETQIMGT